LSKRITNLQKEDLKIRFLNGEDIESLAEEFKYSKLTISRNLIKILGKEDFETYKKNNKKNKLLLNKIKKNDENQKNFNKSKDFKDNEVNLSQETFFEVVPLNQDFTEHNRKDFSSVSIEEITFPNIVYMIVDKKIELKVKSLKEYPQWLFLSKEELERKTIQIFNDLKTAKRECGKENKVIKIPNTNVFKTVAGILSSRGISRIINEDKLISL
tara:strand:+ start:9273 stop:9914 length:642 start_codon:yes stop_codon:yes gene_type:complete